jgi:hypothetical protein
MRSKLARLSHLAAHLGWGPLTPHQHRIPAEAHAGGRAILRWYESNPINGIHLQINENPPYAACVLAFRYRICTGWLRFDLPEFARRLHSEADRLAPYLRFSHFATREGRREFRRNHPDLARFSFRRIRSDGYPDFDNRPKWIV